MIKRRTLLFRLLYKLKLLPNVICPGKVRVNQSLNPQGRVK